MTMADSTSGVSVNLTDAELSLIETALHHLQMRRQANGLSASDVDDLLKKLSAVRLTG